MNITSFETKRFEIYVYNNGTSTVTVDMNTSTHESWKVYVSPNAVTLEPQEGTNVTLIVKIQDLRKVTNGQYINIQVWGQVNRGNETQEQLEFSNYLTFTVTANVPPAQEEEKPWYEEFFDSLSEFYEEHGTTLIYAIVGIIVLVVVLAIVVNLRGKKEEDEEVEFKDLNIKVEDSGSEEKK